MRSSFVSLSRRILSALLLGGVLIGTPACDSNDQPDDEGIDGIWAGDGDDAIFFHITGTAFTVYDYLNDPVDEGPDCYAIDRLDVVSTSGNRLTLEFPDAPGLQLVFSYTRDGDRLRITFLGETATLIKSGRAISSFTPECDGGKDATYGSLADRLAAER